MFKHVKRDVADARDYLFKDYNTMVSSLNYDEIDLAPLCSPIEDQLTIGSCVANSAVGQLEFLENKYKQVFVDLSRLFIYYNARADQCDVSHDTGTTNRIALKTLAKYGVCTEKMLPYKVVNFAKKPSKECYADAATRKITKYYRLSTTAEFQQCLADGFPFMCSLALYPSMESSLTNGGLIPLPSPNEVTIGNHSIEIVGHSRSKKRYKIRNSWGTEVGDKGYFYVPEAYLTNKNLAFDMWTIR